MNSDDPVREPTHDGPVIPVTSGEPTAEEQVTSRVGDPALASSTSQQALPQPGLVLSIALTTVPLFAQLGLVVILWLIALALVVATRSPEGLLFLKEFQVVFVPMGSFLTLLVAIGVCWLFFGRSMGRNIGWRGVSWGQLACVLALTFPLAVLATEVTNCVSVLMQQFEADWMRMLRETNGESFFQFVAQPAWLVFVGGCLLPGLGEEIYCRGLLSRGLVARYGVVGGTLLAAGLFGAMHIEPVQAIGAFALGIGLQFVFLTTRSLIAPIVLHTLNNSLAFLTMRFAEAYPLPGLTPASDGSIAHVPMLVSVTSVLAAATLMVIMMQNRTRWRLSDGSDWNPGYVTAEIPAAALEATAVRGAVNPLMVVGAMVAFGLFVGALVVSHLSAVPG